MSIMMFKQKAAEGISIEAYPFKSELVMEAFIIENETILSYPKVELVKILTSQLFLVDGRNDKLTNGRIDILAEIIENDSKNHYLAVVELKNGPIIKDHLTQLESYLTSLSKQKTEVLKKITKIPSDYEKLPLLGILIGTEISDVKELIENSGSTNKEHPYEIRGIKLNRYKTEDKIENYFITEYFAPHNSSSIRYSDIEEFFSKINSSDEIKELLRTLHEEIILRIECAINYKPKVLSFNVPKKQVKTVFVYVTFYTKKIKVGYYVPKSYGSMWQDIDIDDIKDINDALMEKIKTSYKIINSLSQS